MQRLQHRFVRRTEAVKLLTLIQPLSASGKSNLGREKHQALHCQRLFKFGTSDTSRQLCRSLFHIGSTEDQIFATFDQLGRTVLFRRWRGEIENEFHEA